MPPLEQQDAQSIFQPLDPSADAGLRGTKHIRCVMEVQHFSDDDGMA
jgi:hypothetical protein